MPKALKNYISYNPSILSGNATVSGTRIPVDRVFSLVKQGYSTSSLEEEFPHVEPKKIQNLIAYLMRAGLDAYETSRKIQVTSR